MYIRNSQLVAGEMMDIVMVGTYLEHTNTTGAGRPGNVEGAGNAGGPERAQQARDCTFSSFMKCGPTQFHGKEGAIELCRWFEKMESTFGISECAERNKVKFAAATLQGRALTWWNTQVATLGLAEANGKSWDDMKKMMLEEFCPEEEISRMEDELRNLRLRDHDIAAYTNRFNELVLLCPEVVPSIKKKISQYIKGLPSYIQGETYSSKPTTLNEAIRMAHGLMEQKVQGWKEKNAEQNKRKWEGGNQGNNQGNRGNNRGDNRDNHRHNQNNNRRNGGARAMTQAQGENVNQGGHAPKCNRCNVFHFGNCPVKCNKCGKRGHIAKDCRGKGVATGANTEPIKVCYKCGDPNHLANSELCPEKKKLDGRNASGHVYAVKNVDQAQGPNVVTGVHVDPQIEAVKNLAVHEVANLKNVRRETFEGSIFGDVYLHRSVRKDTQGPTGSCETRKCQSGKSGSTVKAYLQDSHRRDSETDSMEKTHDAAEYLKEVVCRHVLALVRALFALVNGEVESKLCMGVQDYESKELKRSRNSYVKVVGTHPRDGIKRVSEGDDGKTNRMTDNVLESRGPTERSDLHGKRRLFLKKYRRIYFPSLRSKGWL
ncbi:putative reverse transcriptase domain-containing protein [Tanacetum coccineum]